MSSEVKIRFANKSDFDFLNSNVYVSDEILQRKIEWQEIIVAEKNDVQIGFLQLEYLWSSVPYIALIKVLPEFQRQGVGKKLLEFTESLLRENGHKEIYSSSQANEPQPQQWH
ncbi:MAG: GNAT family N-acetyltransferase, partial [Aridibacter sp.]